MNKNIDSSQTTVINPPRLIPSLTSGFNAVANHIQLIIIPILLDLLLWFGPHLKLEKLLYPAVINAVETVKESGNPQAVQMVAGIEQIWKLFLERYNLLSSLSTFPLGIPSLMATQPPLKNPMGTLPSFEIISPFLAILLWLSITLLGFLFGSVYFSFIGQACRVEAAKSAGSPPHNLTAQVLAWQMIQMVLLVLFLTILLMVLFVPTIVITSLLMLLSPLLSSIVLMGMGILTLWVLIPLVFSPHGIFAFRQNALNAALNSARVVRFFLPGTGLFVLAAVIVFQGMGLLWHTPPESSWMTLIGIAGNAFICTGLLASSFAYYFSAVNWVQAVRQQASIPGPQA